MAAGARILLIDQDAESRLAVHSALVRSPYVVVAGGGYGEDALALASEVSPGAIILGMSDPIAEALPTLEGLAKAFPKTPIIVHSDVRDYKAFRRVMLAGAWHYLAGRVDGSNLVATIEQTLSSAPPKKSHFRGTVVTVFSPKGGVGKSTVCTNLAAALAKVGAAPVVVDLDPAFGDLARLMNLPAEPSLLDLARNLASLDGDPLSAHLLAHQSGVSVLPAPEEPSDPALSPEALGKLLHRLATEYDFVILDTPASLSPTVTLALDRADMVLLLTAPDPLVVQAASASLRTLASRPSNGKVKVAVNRVSPSSPLSEGDVAKVLELPLAWSLPYDAQAVVHDKGGLPVVLRKPNAKISRSFSDMAAHLLRLRMPPSLQPPPVGTSHGVFPQAFEASQD